MARSSDRLVTAALVGGFVVMAAILGTVSLYAGMIGQAMSAVPRGAAMPSYSGRPIASEAPASAPFNYLFEAVDGHGVLAAVVIAHLSAERDRLDLVGLPSTLLVDVPGSGQTRLADAYASDPTVVLQGVETLLGVRMDHQIVIVVPRFVRLADAFGGVTVQNLRETSARGFHWSQGAVSLTGSSAVAYVESPTSPLSRLARVTTVADALIARMSEATTMANPSRVDALAEAMTNCLLVDGDLTADVVRQTAMELRLTPDSVAAVALPIASIDPGSSAARPDPSGVGELAIALGSDTMAAYSTAHPDSWAALLSLERR